MPLGKLESLSIISFQRFVFLTATLPIKSFLMSYLRTVDECARFPNVWASSAARSKLVSHLFLREFIFRYVSSFLVSFRGLPLRFLSSTFPVFCCFFRISRTPHLETPVWRAISAWECPCSSNITTRCLVAIDTFVILVTVNILFIFIDIFIILVTVNILFIYIKGKH